MKYTSLNENLKFSRIIAGCMRTLDAGMDGNKLRNFVHNCMDMGIDTFDHAPVYGAGGCEKIFGDEVLRKDPELRSKIKIVTKAGIILPGQKGNKHIFYDSTKSNLLAEMDASLNRLGTDHVDLLLIHRPDVLSNPEETAEALTEIVKAGKHLMLVFQIMSLHSLKLFRNIFHISWLQIRWSFLFKATYNFFNGVVDNAQMNKTALMAWSPLGGGSVFKGEDEQSVRLRTVLETIAKEHQTDIDVVMYAFVLKHPAEIMPITGTMNVGPCKKCCRCVGIRSYL